MGTVGSEQSLWGAGEETVAAALVVLLRLLLLTIGERLAGIADSTGEELDACNGDRFSGGSGRDASDRESAKYSSMSGTGMPPSLSRCR